MKKGYLYETQIGDIGIVEEDDMIIEVSFGYIHTNCKLEQTELLNRTYHQIEEYLSGKRKVFDIPINPKGTPFQKQVWNTLLDIPYGETRSYGEIAIQIGNPKACRAIGMASHNNPIAILIPCHRVIGKNQKLVGYVAGLDIKEKLLSLEKKYGKNQRHSLFPKYQINIDYSER